MRYLLPGPGGVYSRGCRVRGSGPEPGIGDIRVQDRFRSRPIYGRQLLYYRLDGKGQSRRRRGTSAWHQVAKVVRTVVGSCIAARRV